MLYLEGIQDKLANQESGLAEEKLIKEHTEKEKKLDKLLTEKVGALSKIRDLVSGQSGLEKELKNINDKEDELDGSFARLRERIGNISNEIENTVNGEEELAIHRRKTELIHESALVEEELDEVTKKKVEVLDKIKNLTKNRFELEESLDKIEAEEMGLRRDISNLREKIETFMHDISREIGKMDRLEVVDEIPPDQTESQAEIQSVQSGEEQEPGSEPGSAESLEPGSEPGSAESQGPESGDQNKGFLGMFGRKQDPETESKEDGELDVGMLKEVLSIMDDLLNKLPDNLIDEFSDSEDFKRYEKIYSLVNEFNGDPEQEKFIKENIKDVLTKLDNLLKKLPDEVLTGFSESENFGKYGKLLEAYGIG